VAGCGGGGDDADKPASAAGAAACVKAYNSSQDGPVSGRRMDPDPGELAGPKRVDARIARLKDGCVLVVPSQHTVLQQRKSISGGHQWVMPDVSLDPASRDLVPAVRDADDAIDGRLVVGPVVKMQTYPGAGRFTPR
jgi:hypothetical protein